MNNILEGINIIETIGVILFITFVSSNFISLIKADEITFRNDGKSIPDFLIDFPDLSTSKERYLEAKNKIERFITLLLSRQPAKIELNEEEINDLHSLGIAINQNTPGKHLYYEISDRKIVEHLVEFPVKLSTKIYRTRKKRKNIFSRRL